MKQNNFPQDDIAISVIGFNSPLGTDINTFLTTEISQSHTIDDHDPQKFLKPKGQRFLNKATLIYCNVSFHAIENRQLRDFINDNPQKIGLYDGTELSNLEDCFVFDLTAKNLGPDRVSPMKAPSTIANAAASQMAIQAGIKGPNFSVCAGTAGSLQALDIASLHLKQGIVTFGIISSTEVRNDYQEAIRKGSDLDHRKSSPEIGISMILEKRQIMEREGKTPLAIIKNTHSETFTDENNSVEDQLSDSIQHLNNQYDFDIVIICGGASAINQEMVANKNEPLLILYPENILGDFDNAGGMIGIAEGISIFNGKSNHKTDNENILVVSLDKTGIAIFTVIQKG